MPPRVLLDLSHHCLETAARREHRRLTALLLERTTRDDELEGRLALLRELLETTDFSALRAARPELAGGAPITVELRRSVAGDAPFFRLHRSPTTLEGG